MVLVTGNWRTAMIGLFASLVIFAVVYFTVIQPSTNTANQAIKTSEKQAQQALNQAQKQTTAATGQASSAASQATNNATKLASCVVSAGTDQTKIQACDAKYAN
jgi:type II secretory pathway component PulM